jgi:FkbM family methyltransferase
MGMWSFFEFLNDDSVVTVLDVGAAMLESPSYQSLVDAKRARLIGFEPDADACKKLNDTFGEPHRFYPYFVGDGKPAIFHETNWGPTGSLFEPNTLLLEKFHHLSEVVTPVAQHPITTVRLDDIAEIDDVDFIKIDAQGSELNIFKNAAKILDRAVLIQTEVNFLEVYKGQPMFSDIDAFLRKHGYQFHDFPGMGSRSFKPVMSPQHPFQGFGQRVWADAFYVRDWMGWDTLPADKLKKLAALLHDIVGAYDLVFSALEALDRQLSSALAPRYLKRLQSGGHARIDGPDASNSRSEIAGSAAALAHQPAPEGVATKDSNSANGKVKRVLNVGGNSKDISIPSIYAGWEHLMLDIDPACNPDILCDARELGTLSEGSYDSIYCSHNLEHYHHHDVARVLAGFCHVLKDDGFVHMRVPDIAWLMREVAEKDLDIGDVLYQSPSGPITVRDVVYGYGEEIERSGNDFFAHKTGFSKASLTAALQAAGFGHVFADCSNTDITAVGFKQAPTRDVAALLNLPAGCDGDEADGDDGESGWTVTVKPNAVSAIEANFHIGSGRRLHIGGKQRSDAWEILNVNPAPQVDHVCNANDLSRFAREEFAVIYASHVVEHLDYKGELTSALREWHRVLEPGGQVFISVPDLDVLARLLVAKAGMTTEDRFFVMRMLFGGHTHPHDYHMTGLNEEFLTQFLRDAGFVNIRRVGEFGLFDDASSQEFKGVRVSLNMIAEKPRAAKMAVEDINPQQHSTENRQQDSQDDGARDSILLKTADGMSVSVPATLRCISTAVLLEQERWFERELDFLLRWLEPGMNAVDIGANVGFYCLSMARAVGESGMVVAFEPGSGNRSHLETSREANALANLTISACALSDAEKDGWLSIVESGELNRLDDGTVHSAYSERVSVSTLDIQAREFSWPSIDFVKIDAEGQEARIVAGGREFFSRQSPLIMYEFMDAGANNTALRWIFEALGYRTYRLLGDSSGLVPMGSDETLDSFELNLFAAKPDRAALLAAKGLLVLAPEQVLLSDTERSRALAAMLNQPFAQSFEFSEGDVLDCAYGEAIILYAAYRFIDLSPARRFAALEAALEILANCCRSSPTPTGLATLARVALDLGRRSAAVDALRQLVSANGVELDQPFFPPCARFEALSTENREADWFAAAVYEQLEMSGHYSSYFAASDSTRLKWLCESPFASSEISRRMILRAAVEGMASGALANFLRAEHRHANPAYWTVGGISLLQALL